MENAMKKMESEIDSRRKMLSRCENPDRDFPGKCAITITICNSDDASESVWNMKVTVIPIVISTLGKVN